ncbi:MAG: hypothetical protein QME87_13735 [Bacillota bacterium]|nr:hypothetical protein [Bacillota bacterium]
MTLSREIVAQAVFVFRLMAFIAAAMYAGERVLSGSLRHVTRPAKASVAASCAAAAGQAVLVGDPLVLWISFVGVVIIILLW